MRALLPDMGGLARAIVLALVVLLVARPAFADAASDKTQLDKLFTQLHDAPDAATADAIGQQIWRIWIVPSDADLAGRMAAVLASEQEGDLPTALQLLGQLVIDHPAYAEAWNQRATVEYELGDFDDSLADIDRVLSIEPRHFGALSGRVLIYLARDDHAAALKAMIAALAVDPFLAEKALFPELSRPATQI